MKYAIRKRGDNTILSVKRIKPKKATTINKTTGKSVTVIHYDLPKDVEEITQELYKELVSRNDLPYIKFINGEIVEETEKEKSNRIKKAKQQSEKRQIEFNNKKLAEMLVLLDPFIHVNKEGKQLIKKYNK